MEPLETEKHTHTHISKTVEKCYLNRQMNRGKCDKLL